jgi:chloramphenicol 3-O-phosphotransferase
VAVCIVVNGPSTVGKSTLVTAIQDRASVPLLRFGIDELYRMVPAQWAGGTPDAEHAEKGFRYVPADDDPTARAVANGDDAIQMLRALQAGVLGMVRAGHHVIVDGQGYEPMINAEFHDALRAARDDGGIESTVIELTAKDPDLIIRQGQHQHPAGLALSQSRRGPICPDPDLMLDTSGLSTAAVFDRVWRWLSGRHAILASEGNHWNDTTSSTADPSRPGTRDDGR